MSLTLLEAEFPQYLALIQASQTARRSAGHWYAQIPQTHSVIPSWDNKLAPDQLAATPTDQEESFLDLSAGVEGIPEVWGAAIQIDTYGNGSHGYSVHFTTDDGGIIKRRTYRFSESTGTTTLERDWYELESE